MAHVFLLPRADRAVRRVLCAGGCLALALLTPTVAGAEPPVGAAREAPALAGHAAEAAMRDADAEHRHRRLFFDPARREVGEPGVACDHRAARRPDTIAGRGFVVVALDGVTGRPLVRMWVPPAADGAPSASIAAAEARLRAVVAEIGGAAADPTIERQAFAWCR